MNIINIMNLKLRKLNRAIKSAATYEEWHTYCVEHDRISGADEWKEVDHSPYYDYELIRTRLSEIRQARQHKDVNQLCFHLQEGLHGNLGNISNPLLYTKSKLGTKRLIETYLNEVTDALHFVCDNEFKEKDFNAKLDFFETTGHAYGQSALMLSGGATLGLFHIGVFKTLLDKNLIPSVISGSSAGAIMAGIVGTHTDEELYDRFNPESVFLEGYKHTGWIKQLSGTPVFDGDYLEDCLDFNIKDMTFEEAYHATGRQINITVSPYDQHQEARLLNWKTSPHVLVRKAALASSAVPAIFPPVTLWAKNVHGKKVPYIPTRKWVDGAVKNDLPFYRLARLYGVNHTIVSQTNPHVLPFISRNNDIPKPSNVAWNFITKNVQLNTRLALELIQKRIKINEISLLLDKAQSIIKQKYIGDINLIPPRNPTNLFLVLKNPTVDDITRFITTGEHATWPRLEIIQNTTQISRTFNECLAKLNKQKAKKFERLKLISVN